MQHGGRVGRDREVLKGRLQSRTREPFLYVCTGALEPRTPDPAPFLPVVREKTHVVQHAVRGRGEPEMNGERSTASLAVLLAGIKSAREGRRVEVSEILAAGRIQTP